MKEGSQSGVVRDKRRLVPWSLLQRSRSSLLDHQW